MRQLGIIMIVVVIFLSSCGTTNKKIITSTLIGSWCLKDTHQLNYPIITFNKNSIATFSSKMDTVYSFRYYQKDNFLNLIQPSGSVVKSKIIFINKDSLVFETLLENKLKQVYHKCD